MTAPAASPHTARRAPWALWTTLLAMLLAVQASAGAIRPAAAIEAGTIAAKLTLPAPYAAQFRDTGHALKAAGQRLNAARPDGANDGATPPLPSGIAALVIPPAQAGPHALFGATAPHGDTAASAYRARAPPRAA
jgi:hypothetical protein